MGQKQSTESSTSVATPVTTKRERSPEEKQFLELLIKDPSAIPKFVDFDFEQARERIRNELKSQSKVLRLDRAKLNSKTNITSDFDEEAPNSTDSTPLLLELSHSELYSLDLSFNKLDLFPIRRILNSQKMVLLNQLLLPLQQITELHLQGNSLNNISKDIKLLKNLRVLNISSNNIIVLPEELFEVTTLQVLNLSDNKIQTLSEKVNALVNLEELDMRMNMIKLVPSLSNLKKLRVFKVEKDPGSNSAKGEKHVPHVFSRMAELKEIHFKWMQVTDLETVTQSEITSSSETTTSLFPALETMHLNFNLIKSFPAAFCPTVHLRVLNLAHNKLSTLPAELGQCTSLEELYLHDNLFAEVPEFIFSKFHRLRCLDLAFNHLKAIPAQIIQLRQLERLSLHKNQIEEFPTESDFLNWLVALHSAGILKMFLLGFNPIKSVTAEVLDQVEDLVQYAKTKQTPETTVASPTELLDQVFKTIPEKKEVVLTATTGRKYLQNFMQGCFYGQLLGDALGLASEFFNRRETIGNYGVEPYDTNQFVRDVHRQRWMYGDYTDDSDQMLCIMDSIISCKGINPKDFANRLFKWVIDGYEILGDDGGMGLGRTVKTVVTDFTFLNSEDVHTSSKKAWFQSGKNLAANGAVMRTSILGIYKFEDLNEVLKNTSQMCKVTHYDPRCVLSCYITTTIISLLLQTYKQLEEQGNLSKLQRQYPFLAFVQNPEKFQKEILQRAYDTSLQYLNENDIPSILAEEEKAGAWLEKYKGEFDSYFNATTFPALKLDEPSSIGYTFKAMASATVALRRAFQRIETLYQHIFGTSTATTVSNEEKEQEAISKFDSQVQKVFKDIMDELVMEAGDADSNGAVAGAVLGCFLGVSLMPQHCIRQLPHGEWISNKWSQFSSNL